MRALGSLRSRPLNAGRSSAAYVALLAACVLGLGATAPASADPYGQVGRFSLTHLSPYAITERTAAFGVDSEESNAVYVGEEAPETEPGKPSGVFRIQKYSGQAGEFLN